jgi:ElaA protein
MTERSAPILSTVTWECSSFGQLSPDDLYAAMVLRQIVFVVEQNCTYLDADGLDQQALHLLGWMQTEASRQLVAYARIFPPQVKYAEASVGRVVTHPDARGTGAGLALMDEGIRRVEENGWGSQIRIAAQMYLEGFYERFGFQRVTEPYLEDNIWQVDMRRG